MRGWQENEINYFITVLSVNLFYKSQGQKDIKWYNKIQLQLKLKMQWKIKFENFKWTLYFRTSCGACRLIMNILHVHIIKFLLKSKVSWLSSDWNLLLLYVQRKQQGILDACAFIQGNVHWCLVRTFKV